jgi:cytidylate kinase
MINIIIAIDGFAGSGKSTTARLVANSLNYIYIDTGAMYRAVTLKWLRTETPLAEENVCKVLSDLDLELHQGATGQIVVMNGEDVSSKIRTLEVSNFVSPVSAYGCVREKMVEQQRQLGKEGGVVMDGRDIGSFVFPNAQLKIFLTASVEERAKRRVRELEQKGMNESIESLIKNITERDYFDSHREISPLTKASDAIEIDTTFLTITQQCEKIIELAQNIIGE